MTAAAFLFGLICGGAVVAILLAKSDRDLRERAEWERDARCVLRGVARGDEHAMGYGSIAKRLLSDEAGV